MCNRKVCNVANNIEEEKCKNERENTRWILVNEKEREQVRAYSDFSELTFFRDHQSYCRQLNI